MEFLRRLFGTKPEKSPSRAEQSADHPVRPAPEITAPDESEKMVIQPPAPIIQVPKGTKIDAPIMAESMPGFGVTRQLPPSEPMMARSGKHLIMGLNSDVGMVRNNNQDSVFTMYTSQVSADGLPDFGLFVVADGMGGHHDGERASALAARVIANYVINTFYLKMMDHTVAEEDRPIIGEVLNDALQRANEAVAVEIPEGGTTVTAAAVVGDLAYIAHVGDSRAYLFTSDGIEQITRDHSLVQRLIELDQLTPDEAAMHPQRNVLYRAVGQNEQIEIDAVTRRLPAGSRLMLCSDGLWAQVPEDKLTQIVTTSRAPQEACDRLVAIANERGGNDNITIILVQVPG